MDTEKIKNILKMVFDPKKIIAIPMNIVDKTIISTIDIVSVIIYAPVWLWRHKSLRNILLWVSIASLLIFEFFGLSVLFGLVSQVAQFAFAAIFMIAQFAFLFFFLSNTKNIETMPGDKGLVSFDGDYFGNEYLVKSIKEWVSLMSRDGKEKLDKLGAKPINGILLVGPPGTGKTLLAQCLATSTESAFIGMSGTDFQAMFIGVGPMKVMRTKSKAQKKADQVGSCIVFIDEIDAIGGSRGGVEGEKNQPQGGAAGGLFGGGGLGVLSKLLTVMDETKELTLRRQIVNKMRGWYGYEPVTQGQVLWMGATNRPTALDSALTRPGRIDKKIRVDPPDRESRKKIIKGYLNKINHDDSVDVDRLADDLQGVTPAQISSSIERSAARYTINDGRNKISMDDIENAFQEDIVGLANPITNFDPRQKEQVAVHEAGHAIASHILFPKKRITTISIIRRGSGVLGYMRDVEQEEIYAKPLEELAAMIQVLWAGHIATDLILGKPWTGASRDIEMIQGLMVGLAFHGQFASQIPLNPREPFASADIKCAADEYMLRAQAGTRKLLEDNKAMLITIRDALLEKDEIHSKEIYEILERKTDNE
ncbi:hypothetical protein LCGC14_0996010 [marine sediment metagenome]|uniref:AAA+ ATPase domain-containing protein n=1 Tax=marine sediment metagenome TaxID=412755 RepID=A0A0F9N913_9ZZZZ